MNVARQWHSQASTERSKWKLIELSLKALIRTQTVVFTCHSLFVSVIKSFFDERHERQVLWERRKEGIGGFEEGEERKGV